MFSTSTLRDSLLQVRREYDPNGKDEAFNRMVLVGHSLGGILAKTMVQNSQNEIWELFSEHPLDTFELTEHEDAMIEKMVYFKPLPFTERVIFISSPHRGAEMANSWIGRIGSALIKLPNNLLTLHQDLMASMGHGIKANMRKFIGQKPTSIKGLAPENPVLQTLVAIPIADGVTYHSIMGNRDEAGVPGTDGVVSYSSAHLEGAATEIIIHSDHESQKKPAAIAEVRRILHEHLEDY